MKVLNFIQQTMEALPDYNEQLNNQYDRTS